MLFKYKISIEVEAEFDAPLLGETKEKLKNAWKERKNKFGSTGKSSEYVAYNKGKKLNKDNKSKREYL